MLEAIYSAAGYRVGCYTSPHLVRYNERIRIQREPRPDAEICAAFERVDAARADISLTYFEFGTLAALDLFACAGLDLAILEVGLGGRLDAVNIVDPELALITSIDLDHQDWLGPDRERIGGEKAGILRAGRPAVCGDRDPPESLLRRAAELGTPLYCAERDFRWRRAPGGWQWEGPGSRRFGLPEPALRGAYQLANGAAVLMAVELLANRLPVAQEAVRLGLQTAVLPGRFQVIPGDVTLVLDVAHNPQAANALAGNLRRLAPGGRVHAVFGLLGDKDLRGVLQPLAELVDSWHLPQLAGSRARSVAALAGELRAILPGVEVTEYPAPRLALNGAQLAASVGDCILVFGSFVLVGELLPEL